MDEYDEEPWPFFRLRAITRVPAGRPVRRRTISG